MFNDIAGYTDLMSRDEQAAVRLLEKNRLLHQSALEEFNGRLIKEIGDGILACFNTASHEIPLISYLENLPAS